jgi:hypothetical protein
MCIYIQEGVQIQPQIGVNTMYNNASAGEIGSGVVKMSLAVLRW